MAFPIIAAATALAELAPGLFKWLKPDPRSGTKNKTYEIATKVVDVARKVSGTEDNQSAIAALKHDPELLIQFQQNMADLERDLTESEVADRDSARQRDIAMMELGRSNSRADIMVIAAALGLICCLVSLAVFKGELPGEAVGIISTVAGIFGACLKDAYAFEFGSSRGSKNKDIRNIAEELNR